MCQGHVFYEVYSMDIPTYIRNQKLNREVSLSKLTWLVRVELELEFRWSNLRIRAFSYIVLGHVYICSFIDQILIE